MTAIKRHSLALALVCSLAATPALAAKTWKVNLKDADIGALVTEVAEITGKNFIIDPRVKGAVSVVSTQEMSADQVYDLFLGVLSVNGFAAVPSGKNIKIVPDMNAKTSGVRVDVSDKGRGDDMVTRVLPVEGINALDLVPLLRPMMPQYAHLAAVPSANALIVSDRVDNVRALADIVRRLSGGEGESIEVVTLAEVRVADVLGMLESLAPIQVGSGKDAKGYGRVRVVADERSNRVILRGDDASRKRIKDVIKQLDVPPTELNSGGVQVIRLRHAVAKQMAEVLRGLVSADKSGGSVPAVAAAGAAGGSGVTAVSGGGVSIIADEASNALVVRADPVQLRDIRRVIEALDQRRSQVLIQAAIVEVSGTTGEQLGVQWVAMEKDAAVGVVNFNTPGPSILSILGAAKADKPELIGQPNGALIGLGNVKKDSSGNLSGFGAVIQALDSVSNANLLSTPSIMTLDNQEAKIVVGQNVPFITGQTTSSSGGTSNPFTTISREDVGITLKVTPRISDSGTVRLDVEQEVSAVLPSASGVNSADIITSKRSIKTSILADDGQTIVLGGLIQDDTTNNESKVPLLGDIPFLGRLFKATTDGRTKRNLMVFLQPQILRDRDTVAAISRSHYDDIRTLQLSVGRKGEMSQLPETMADMYRGEPAEAPVVKAQP